MRCPFHPFEFHWTLSSAGILIKFTLFWTKKPFLTDFREIYNFIRVQYIFWGMKELIYEA